MARSDRQAVEIFHLTLLSALGATLDKRLFALKGGCNLRFFFKSPRLSEDMDFDVVTVGVDTLKTKVKRLLDGQPLRLQLEAAGISVEEWSAPKQTATTQRWKIRVRAARGPRGVATKLEFSRRGVGDGVVLDPVDPLLVEAYGLAPIMAPHYSRSAAFAQKVVALADRVETQARDVFDLDLLLRGGALPSRLPPSIRARLDAARQNTLSLSYDDFVAQVHAYLPEDEQPNWDAEAWDRAVLRVMDALDAGGGSAA